MMLLLKAQIPTLPHLLSRAPQVPAMAAGSCFSTAGSHAGPRSDSIADPAEAFVGAK